MSNYLDCPRAAQNIYMRNQVRNSHTQEKGVTSQRFPIRYVSREFRQSPKNSMYDNVQRKVVTLGELL